MAQDKAAIKEIQAIAEEAYLYGFPMIVGYKVQAGYAVQPLSAFLGEAGAPRCAGDRLAEVRAGGLHDPLRRVPGRGKSNW